MVREPSEAMSHQYPERERKRALEYYYENREKVLAQQKAKYHPDAEFRARSIEGAKRRHASKMHSDPEYRERMRQRALTLKATYGDAQSSSAKERRRLNKRKWRQANRGRDKSKIFDALGRKCSCCGESHMAFLTVDHTNGDGAEHKRKLGSRSGLGMYRDIVRQGIPKDRFRILCMNCNWATRTGKECPHQAAK